MQRPVRRRRTKKKRRKKGETDRFERTDKREGGSGAVDEVLHVSVLARDPFESLRGRIRDHRAALRRAWVSERFLVRNPTATHMVALRGFFREFEDEEGGESRFRSASTFSTASSVASNLLRRAFASRASFLCSSTELISSCMAVNSSWTRTTSFLTWRTGFRTRASDCETWACFNPSERPIKASYSSLMTPTRDCFKLARYSRSSERSWSSGVSRRARRNDDASKSGLARSECEIGGALGSWPTASDASSSSSSVAVLLRTADKSAAERT